MFRLICHTLLYIYLIRHVGARLSSHEDFLSVNHTLLGRGEPRGTFKSNNHVAGEYQTSIAYTSFTKDDNFCEQKAAHHAGYVSINGRAALWFWFFEAREDPETAPLVAWLSGGPGVSSMMDIFHGNGICNLDDQGDETVGNNVHSINRRANVIYVDQPFDVGFSLNFESNPYKVNNSKDAASFVWALLQSIIKEFGLRDRTFSIATISFGGHYGPALAQEILDRNVAIEGDNTKGVSIKLKALTIFNGLFDLHLMFKHVISYTKKFPLPDNPWTEAELLKITKVEESYDLCSTALSICKRTKLSRDCTSANNYCREKVRGPLVTLLREKLGGLPKKDFKFFLNLPRPPHLAAKFLSKDKTKSTLRANSVFKDTNQVLRDEFVASGDLMKDMIPTMMKVREKVHIYIVAGDHDLVGNWLHSLKSAQRIAPSLKQKPLQDYNVNGVGKGTWQVDEQSRFEGSVSFMRIFNAGHGPSDHQPETVLQLLEQIVLEQNLKST